MGYFRFLPKVNPCAVDHSKRKLQPLPGRRYDHPSPPHPRIPGCGPPDSVGAAGLPCRPPCLWLAARLRSRGLRVSSEGPRELRDASAPPWTLRCQLPLEDAPVGLVGDFRSFEVTAQVSAENILNDSLPTQRNGLLGDLILLFPSQRVSPLLEG